MPGYQNVAVVDSLNNVDERWMGKVNPVTAKQIQLYRQTIMLGDALDNDELAIFKAQFVTLLAAPGSEERKLMLDRLDAYIYALRAIKSKLGGIKFTGLNPEDVELGFGPIRPVFTQFAGAVKVTWAVALSQVWAQWLSAAPGVGYQIGNAFGMCITHLKSYVTPNPFMAEAQFTTSRTGILIPISVRGLRMGDTENAVSIVPIPTLILSPQSTLFAQARSDTVGAVNDEIEPAGLVFGLGRVLNATVAYPAL